jgi:magnesium/cobalt transport protein CorA
MGGKSKRRNAALNRRAKKSGLPPGTLVHIGEKREEAVRITYMDYDERSFQEKQGVAVEECFPFKQTETITWIIDAIEGFRDIVSGMLDVYLSSISNRTNAIMKVLTMIATIFIPLTFVAGVYGMNFKHMPEIGWRWGYPAVLVLMISIAGVMIAYFRSKRWL